MLPSSGQISMSQVNTEGGYGATAQISLNDSWVRTMFEVASGQISLSNGWGKPIPRGHAVFGDGSNTLTWEGTYFTGSFVVPANVTSVCIVAVGAFVYRGSRSIGNMLISAGPSSWPASITGIGGNFGGGNGGLGGDPGQYQGEVAGGGGAGGYTGNGGNGCGWVWDAGYTYKYFVQPQSGSGGGAAGGYQSWAGFGTALYGQGASGVAPVNGSTAGGSPYGSTSSASGAYGAGNVPINYGSYSTPGGMGKHLRWGNNIAVTPGETLYVEVDYQVYSNQTSGLGGGVRFIWGSNRAFPSTNVSTSTN